MSIYFHIFLSLLVFIISYTILSPKTPVSYKISKFIPKYLKSKSIIYSPNANHYITINQQQKKNSIFAKYILNQKTILISAGFYSDNAIKVLNYIKILIFLSIIFISCISYSIKIDPIIIFAFAIIIELCSTRYIKYLKTKRLNAIRLELPNVLDLFVILANAGYTIHNIFKISANELSFSNPKIATELAKTALEFDLSPDVEGILSRFSERIPIKEVQNFTSILTHAYKFGSGLKESIAAFSEDLQNKRLLTIEDKAGKIPNILIMPMVFFILPCLIIVILAPLIVKLIARFIV